jgi:hypothetical protein
MGYENVEAWDERVAIMIADGGLQHEEAERLGPELDRQRTLG